MQLLQNLSDQPPVCLPCTKHKAKLSSLCALFSFGPYRSVFLKWENKQPSKKGLRKQEYALHKQEGDIQILFQLVECNRHWMLLCFMASLCCKCWLKKKGKFMLSSDDISINLQYFYYFEETFLRVNCALRSVLTHDTAWAESLDIVDR